MAGSTGYRGGVSGTISVAVVDVDLSLSVHECLVLNDRCPNGVGRSLMVCIEPIVGYLPTDGERLSLDMGDEEVDQIPVSGNKSPSWVRFPKMGICSPWGKKNPIASRQQSPIAGLVTQQSTCQKRHKSINTQCARSVNRIPRMGNSWGFGIRWV